MGANASSLERDSRASSSDASRTSSSAKSKSIRGRRDSKKARALANAMRASAAVARTPTRSLLSAEARRAVASCSRSIEFADGTLVPVDGDDPWAKTHDRDGRALWRADAGALRAGDHGPRRMVVEILAARNLEGTDLGGTSDPYASVALGEITRKTSTAFRTCDPAWGERFEFIAAKALEDDEVIVTLYDEDLVGAHDFLGQITIPVRAVDEARRGGSERPWVGDDDDGEPDANCSRVRAHWVKLQSKRPPPERDRGVVTLGCYLDADVEERLHVTVASARGIEAASVRQKTPSRATKKDFPRDASLFARRASLLDAFLTCFSSPRARFRLRRSTDATPFD
ncbi:uncharacterized protein MICPUCDRAFT_63907 [Micromonas pusilla CCMP1545]|uniref:Predicted protein n=1 Tax=Micromonas pusilla (strain CCMP1545) TaxID=564608 RepID=C1N6A9_MICPC|nr:uncharacterized protein MICPUCDRAFT_63907 [Micromonas pusilla CCMP1545]EEH52441.1 predicted protein [Micromonas pusilla CCMP1545]|eukprot:XP_003063305.1 predicted protein [Micromonas pusilla CCMP1545]